MTPTYSSGTRILVNRLFYLFTPLKKGDIIVFRSPRDKMILIKRVERIHKEKIFVLGDNKRESIDSRVFGMITKKDIIGKVIFKVHSL